MIKLAFPYYLILMFSLIIFLPELISSLTFRRIFLVWWPPANKFLLLLSAISSLPPPISHYVAHEQVDTTYLTTLRSMSPLTSSQHISLTSFVIDFLCTLRTFPMNRIRFILQRLPVLPYPFTIFTLINDLLLLLVLPFVHHQA